MQRIRRSIELSGKLTARPLVFLTYQVRRLIRIVVITPKAVMLGGGIVPTMKKAYRMFRRDRFRGLWRGLRYVGSMSDVGRAAQAARNNYAEWVRQYDTLRDIQIDFLQARLDKLASRPKISVLMPTFNPKPEWLIEAIESVRRQIYPEWELCIADDASTNSEVRRILNEYMLRDSRINVAFRDTNGHICVSSNSALDLVSGEFTALLDHDDLLPRHALLLVAEAILANPDACLIYSDEDKVNESGLRNGPYFKCDWNPDLFLSQNMISHLGVYRSSLMRAVGGFRPGFEGSQDYDLALRCTERLRPDQIVHIPYVLYHWRVHEDSTAAGPAAKPYAAHSARRAIEDHLQRTGTKASVSINDFGMYQCSYEVPIPMPRVTLIIPTRNGKTLVKRCVDSVLNRTDYQNYEILIVDNGSDERDSVSYFQQLSQQKIATIIEDSRPFNFSALNNFAAAHASGEILALLNNDIEVITPNWLTEMVGQVLRKEVGAVGARLWYPDETLQHGGIVTGIGKVAGMSHKNLPRGNPGYLGRAALVQCVSAVTAACMVVRKSVYQSVGGLDEINLAVAYNDVDFCLRLREAGYRIIWLPQAELYHHESATRGFDESPENAPRYQREVGFMLERWGEMLTNDPFYSPNLTLQHEDYSLAWPPRIRLNPVTA